jgi:hypothetical protein
MAAERCAEARREFVLEVGRESPENIVCVDESAVNVLTTYCQNGWAYQGVRARKRCNFVRGARCVLHILSLEEELTFIQLLPSPRY